MASTSKQTKTSDPLYHVAAYAKIDKSGLCNEFLVHDQQDVQYLELRCLGKTVDVEFESSALKTDGDKIEADGKNDCDESPPVNQMQKYIQKIIVLSEYDVYYLKKQIVVFKVPSKNSDENDARDAVSKTLDCLNSLTDASLGNLELFDLKALFESIDREYLMVYLYLKRKNYVVNDGISYGVDFLVYEGHPADNHAKYGLVVESPTKKLQDWHELIMVVRNLNQVKKKALLAKITYPELDPESPATAPVNIRMVELSRWDPDTTTTTFYKDKNPNKFARLPSCRKRMRLPKKQRLDPDSKTEQ